MEQIGTQCGERLPFSIGICGLRELPNAIMNFRPTHVISITDPGDAPVDFLSSISVLRLAFRDIHTAPARERRAANDAELPTMDHAENILDFGRRLPDHARVLIHCWAGVSRSTAAAYLLIAQAMPGDELGAFDLLKAIRPHAQPNRLLIRHGDRLLGSGKRMLRCVDRGRS